MDLLLYFVPVILILVVQSKFKNTFNEYSQIPNERGLNGAEVAREILTKNNIHDVTVQLGKGHLSDNYNPKTKTISLSEQIYYGTSIASLAVASHEVGHAIQYNVGYGFIRLRNAILPAAITAGNLSWVVIMLGFAFLRPIGPTVLWIGIGMFAIVALFQLVTLPVEFDASNRALAILQTDGYLYEHEYVGAKKVLNAAAMTYVMALVSTLAQLLRLVLISNRSRD